MTDLKVAIRAEMERAGTPPSTLAELHRRRARRQRNERIGAGAIGLAVALAAVLIGSNIVRSGMTPGVSPGPSGGGATAAVPDGLVGRFTASFFAGSGPDLHGQWRLRVFPDGRITLSGTLDGRPIGEEGRLDVDPANPSQLLVDLFSDGACSGSPTGRYSWGSVGSVLRLMVVDDPCRLRARAVTIEDHVWRRAT